MLASIYHPVGTALVFSTAEKTGRAIAINALAGNLGLACAAGVTALLSQAIGWQAAFLIPGILCVLAGVAYTLVSKDIQIFHQRTNRNNESYASKNNLIKMFAVIAIIACFGGLVFQSLTTALPKIIDASFDISISKTGMLSTIIYILAAVIQLVIGELLDWISARTLLLFVTSSQVIFLMLAAFTSGWMLIPVFIGLISSTYAQIPINDWLIGRYSSDQWRSRIYAMKYMVSFSTAPIAYWLIAIIYGKTSEFSLLYGILATGMLLSTLAVWLMPVIRPEPDKAYRHNLA